MENNYKSKYMNLRSQYMSAVDTAFRLGFQQGQVQAQQDQMAQQQQQAQEMAAQQPPGMGPDQQDESGQNPEQAEQPGQEAAATGHPAGSELDQHIAKLESMLGKGEISGDDLRKSIDELKELKKSLQFEVEMKKSAAAIPKIAHALHKPAFKIGQQASVNMNDNAKKAVSMQEKIVGDIFKSWESEEKKAVKSIADIINVEGITSKGE